MYEKYDGGVYWLLDLRFDFLLPSFLRKFGIDEKDIILVNSYHGNTRGRWKKKEILPAGSGVVSLREADEINQAFSSDLPSDKDVLVVSFIGAGLPQSSRLTALTATGQISEKCNDKWWQYCFMKKMFVPVPDTYRYPDIDAAYRAFPLLMERYKKLIIKKPRLSGGYRMQILSSDTEFWQYRREIGEKELREDFLISQYIPHQQSFAGMGIVLKNGDVVFFDMITEQVLYREVAYEGLIYPAFLEEHCENEIRAVTIKIGKELGLAGYHGFFNVDFVLGENQLYVVEINARLGFGTILAACLYGEKIWSVLCGNDEGEFLRPPGRLVIGKIKGKAGRTYKGLSSHSDLEGWFRSGRGYFETFFCGTGEPELFEYGSYIGIFGEFFAETDERVMILNKFWKRCIRFYK